MFTDAFIIKAITRTKFKFKFIKFLTASSVAIAVLQVAVLGLAILSISLYNDNIML